MPTTETITPIQVIQSDVDNVVGQDPSDVTNFKDAIELEFVIDPATNKIRAFLPGPDPVDEEEPIDEVVEGTDFNPFIGSGASQMRKGSNTSGSGATVAQGWEWVNTTNNWLGAIKCETGTTASGRAAMHVGNNALIFGSMAYMLETVISVEVLSTVSEEYVVLYGFTDTAASTTPTRGAYFRYDRLNEGGSWIAVTESGSTETTTDTGVEVTAGFTQAGQKLKIVVDADGGAIRFYIDDVLEATHTTNINTASRGGFVGIIEKTAGTTEVGVGFKYERFSWSDTNNLD